MASGLLFVLLLGIGGNLISEAAGEHITLCENSQIYLKCGHHQVISVRYANYGRHDYTTCSDNRPPSQLQDVSCSLPTDIVAQSCNGNNDCTITASNSVFGDPCYGTYKYLEVSYDCRRRW